MCYWEHEEFIIRNYCTNGQIIATPAVIRLLDAAREFIEPKALRALVSFLPRAKDVIDLLKEEAILLAEESAEDIKDRKIGEAWIWGHDARCFHYGTQHVRFSFDSAQVRSDMERKAAIEPPPSPFKKCVGSISPLPPPIDCYPRMELAETLLKRRTCREFDKKKPLPLQEFSQILKLAFGFQMFFNTSKLDQRIIKTSPSGGARHPIETYVCIRNVEGHAPGIYHYTVSKHELVKLRPIPSVKRIVRIFGGQTWMGDASAIFIFSAVLARSMWKYEHSRAYRVVTLDAGHLVQTFLLLGTALGFGVCSTAAFDDTSLEKLINIDGVSEVVVYSSAIGFKSI